MQAGIVGFPGCGKTTVYRALTGLKAGAESGSKGRVARGVVKVPDPRIDVLARMYEPEKITPAEIVFTDIPGPGPGQGEEGGGQTRSIPSRFVGDMRATDLLVHVVREFVHPDGTAATPERDLAALRDETIIQDLDVVEKRLAKLGKGEKCSFPSEKEVLVSIQTALGSSKTIRDMDLPQDTLAQLASYAFLTAKPELVVINRDDAQAGAPIAASLEEMARRQARAVIPLCARLEVEIGQIEPAERGAFMAEMGIETAGTEVFVRAAYASLGLVSFFTTGPDEVRAWTIRSGTPAVKAAGKIHTDLERGFIRAEVVSYEDLIALGDEAACKKAGKMRQEGKEYLVKDGDIINIKFNA